MNFPAMFAGHRGDHRASETGFAAAAARQIRALNSELSAGFSGFMGAFQHEQYRIYMDLPSRKQTVNYGKWTIYW